jgi:hypothetical protein
MYFSYISSRLEDRSDYGGVEAMVGWGSSHRGLLKALGGKLFGYSVAAFTEVLENLDFAQKTELFWCFVLLLMSGP